LINEYLAEKYPEAGLAPTAPLQWYNAQSWSKFVDYNLSSSLATLGCNRYLVPVLKDFDRGKIEKSVDAIPIPDRRPGWRVAVSGDYPNELIKNSERKVELVTQRMERILGDSDWLLGDAYSIADIDTFALIHGLRDVVPGIVNTKNTPKTEAWHGRIAGRSAVKDALARNTGRQSGSVYAPGPEHSRWG
jgi:glutathione S-transferase